MRSRSVVVRFVSSAHPTRAAWLLVTRLPQLQTTPALLVLVLSWAFSDVVRYAWAAAASWSGDALHALTRARYTLFLPAYPLGAGAEWVLLRAARPLFTGASGELVRLPNAANFAFDYSLFLGVVLLLYPVAFAHMYGHMLAQRRRKLGKAKVI